MSVGEGETYAVEVRRPSRWRAEATVFLCSAGSRDPETLTTVWALTKRGARRRAGTFIAMREALAAERLTRAGERG
jgi:hypothetical protein